MFCSGLAWLGLAYIGVSHQFIFFFSRFHFLTRRSQGLCTFRIRIRTRSWIICVCVFVCRLSVYSISMSLWLHLMMRLFVKACVSIVSSSFSIFMCCYFFPFIDSYCYWCYYCWCICETVFTFVLPISMILLPHSFSHFICFIPLCKYIVRSTERPVVFWSINIIERFPYSVCSFSSNISLQK